MTDGQQPTQDSQPTHESAALDPLLQLPPELEKLPAEIKSSMFSLMMGLFVRSTTGPDPESARVAAQAEMHEETCRLEGYKESLKTRDRQSERDHEFRKKSLNHGTALGLLIAITCIAGIACGLYLLVVKREQTLGTSLLVASFMALLNGGKSILKKDDD
jgi:hypothetical protein